MVEDDINNPRPLAPDTAVKFDYQRYQWLMMVEKLCQKLNYIPEQVYKMNYISALNWLSMWHLQDKVKQNGNN